ncbi:MAG: hypothetical protein Q7J79_04100, partial [Gemmatimonadales bacterium]|nr:hypothetical protein [Gemmatimonadales bacterium]
MIDLTLIPDGGLGWLDASGPLAHVVLSTRIRLARNLARVPFTVRAGDLERRRVLDELDSAWQESPIGKGGARFLLDQLEPNDRQLL